MAFGIDDAIAAGLKLINKFVPDPAAKIQAEKDLRDSLQSWDKMQTDINVEQAKHSSIFVAGARPAIMWGCFAAIIMYYVVAPFITWIGLWCGFTVPDYPMPDGSIMELAVLTLGGGALRTYEKVKGVARK